ncbi:hypothetical protein ABKN59_005585 [Abortiporus biennis]
MMGHVYESRYSRCGPEMSNYHARIPLSTPRTNIRKVRSITCGIISMDKIRGSKAPLKSLGFDKINKEVLENKQVNGWQRKSILLP